MLVLSRKTGECIIIGENIALTVVGIQGGRVRLGVTAPMQRLKKQLSGNEPPHAISPQRLQQDRLQNQRTAGHS